MAALLSAVGSAAGTVGSGLATMAKGIGGSFMGAPMQGGGAWGHVGNMLGQVLARSPQGQQTSSTMQLGQRLINLSAPPPSAKIKSPLRGRITGGEDSEE